MIVIGPEGQDVLGASKSFPSTPAPASGVGLPDVASVLDRIEALEKSGIVRLTLDDDIVLPDFSKGIVVGTGKGGPKKKGKPAAVVDWASVQETLKGIGAVKVPDGLDKKNRIHLATEIQRAVWPLHVEPVDTGSVPIFVPAPAVSFWFCFVTSLDRAQDTNLVKEVVFWGRVYHDTDSIIQVLSPGRARYDQFRMAFGVQDNPALVLADSFHEPKQWIRFEKELFKPEFVGQDYGRVRDLMENLHALLGKPGGFSNATGEVFRKQVASVLGRAWKEVKDLVSVSVKAG